MKILNAFVKLMKKKRNSKYMSLMEMKAKINCVKREIILINKQRLALTYINTHDHIWDFHN